MKKSFGVSAYTSTVKKNTAILTSAESAVDEKNIERIISEKDNLQKCETQSKLQSQKERDVLQRISEQHKRGSVRENEGVTKDPDGENGFQDEDASNELNESQAINFPSYEESPRMETGMGAVKDSVEVPKKENITSIAKGVTGRKVSLPEDLKSQKQLRARRAPMQRKRGMDMGRVSPTQIATMQGDTDIRRKGMHQRRSLVSFVPEVHPISNPRVSLHAPSDQIISTGGETSGHIAGGAPPLSDHISPTALGARSQREYILTHHGNNDVDSGSSVTLFGATSYRNESSPKNTCKSESFFEQNLDMREVEVTRGLSLASNRSNKKKRARPRVHIDALFDGRGLAQSQITRTYHVMIVALMGVGILSTMLFVGKAFAIKDRTLVRAEEAISVLGGASEYAAKQDFDGMSEAIGDAHQLFTDSQSDMAQIGGLIVQISQFIPGASMLASGDALVDAGVSITASAEEVASAIAWVDTEVFSRPDGEALPILTLLQNTYDHLTRAAENLSEAERSLARVALEDIPKEYRTKFSQIRGMIAPVHESIAGVLSLRGALEDLFGKNGPRTYLFLFQNNHEMRPGGGFIGSYGFLDITEGHIREFKVEGIYNPDGQLIDKVVPPRPIQKVSEAWSMHDSNWWPDFPRSAEKAIDFYGRTGGPSVDGVIALTPTVVEKLLDLTGPITLEEYDVTLTADNFVQMTQYEVEVGYDKEENRPKKILSDLMPALITQLQKNLSEETLFGLLSVMYESLNERQLMLYMRNDEIQDVITDKHWGGRLLPIEGNYLSVVHSNINGFKTDGVIDQSITHEAEIYSNGRILNTVTVARTHTGGDTGYPWWDAVNADYMRIYVPRGARLISAEGHTREWHPPRLNYKALGYEIDPDVAREEDATTVHEESGTRIYEEGDKTVFGNWVYVSPGETVRVTYVYELPDRIELVQDGDVRIGTYNTLYQKQAGSMNTSLQTRIIFPERAEISAHVPIGGVFEQGRISSRETEFDVDQYYGVVFQIE